MTNDTLYLKIDQNVQVHDDSVFLKDIAQLECSNKAIENKIKTLKLDNPTGHKPGRHVMSVMEIITQIHGIYPSLEVNNIGESDFIITYEKPKQPSQAFSWLKTIFVCFLSFFGAGFSIMTFNNDVSITKLFAQLYEQFTGTISDGFTILEISYSIGLGLGIIIFFNHFAGKKLTADPTPMEVQMRTYEDDINKALIESSNREPKNEKKMKQ
ncbi:stage V sporulation protein AA [Robinsoniella peoriensis]